MTNYDLKYLFTEHFCPVFDNAHDKATLIRVEDHLVDAINTEKFNDNQLVYIALEGSQNYKLDTNASDVDTKLILLPNIYDVIWNHKPISTTHVRENGEHTSYTDLRNFFQSLRKQNVNFIETLYSPWIIVNKLYDDEINYLLKNKDLISHYNRVKAVKTIGGIATDRYKAIYNMNSARADVIKEYGYDGKSVSHLLRLYYFLSNYIAEKPYEECIVPKKEYREDILSLKNNKMSSNIVENYATYLYGEIQKMVDNYVNSHQEEIDQDAERVLVEVQETIIRKSLKMDLIY